MGGTPDGICADCGGTGRIKSSTRIGGKVVPFEKNCKTCDGTGELHRKR